MIGLGATAAAADAAQQPSKYDNCKALNKVYPHGVGRKGAHDKTTGTPPVSNFAYKPKVYKLNHRNPRPGQGRDRLRAAVIG